MLCINGTGILNAWVHRNITPDVSYADMNDMAAGVPIGSDGVKIIPFGNGAERVLENREVGCSIRGLSFTKHNRAHIVRAAQEGIVFSFCYGMEIMQQMGMDSSGKEVTVKAEDAELYERNINEGDKVCLDVNNKLEKVE